MPTHLAIMDVTPNKRGSFENYTVSLARRLAAEGWQSVQVFWGPPPAWLRAELEEAGTVVRALTEEPEFAGRVDWPAGLGRDLRLVRIARRLVREFNPDVTHLHFFVAFSLLPLMLRLAGVRQAVFTEHISLPFIRRNPLRDLAAWLRNRFSMLFVQKMVAVSDYVRRRVVLCDHVPSNKAMVIYNGIDLDRFQPEGEGIDTAARVRERLGVPEDHRLVVTIGQLIDFKGIHVLVDAAIELKDRQGLTFLAIGEGERRQALEQQAAAGGLGERFRFLGRRDDIAEILRASDLFVLPSVWDEALGYVIVEAMAVGRAVVATRTGGIPEVVIDGQTGLLVERNDAPGLAAAIDALLLDPARRRDMGQAGRQVVEEKFAMEVAIEQTVQLYCAVTGTPPRSTRISIAGAA